MNKCFNCGKEIDKGLWCSKCADTTWKERIESNRKTAGIVMGKKIPKKGFKGVW